MPNRASMIWLLPAVLLLPAAIRGETIAVAHRGLARTAPENTVAAFTAAHGKADLIETDVRVSADGQLVIMHDETVDRTTDGTGTVANLSLAQLRGLDAGSWYGPGFAGQRVPTLAEAITNILPHATPLIEHKTGTAAAYVAVLQQLDAAPKVILQSFDWSFLQAVRALDPSVRTCALGTGPMSYDMLAGAARNGAGMVAWYKVSVDAAGVALAHSLGLKVLVWTVGAGEVGQFLALGVDGIITDVPEQVILAQQPVPEADLVGAAVEGASVFLDVATRGLSSTVGLFRAGSLLAPFEPVSDPDRVIQGRDRVRFLVPASSPDTGGYFRVAVE